MSGSEVISAEPGNALTGKRSKGGNPIGRPKANVDINDMCRRIGPRAVHVIDALMDDADPRIRLQAAVAILDRGFGKPAQTITTPDEALSITFLHLIAARANSENINGHRVIDATVADETNDVASATTPDLMAPATE
jgi:hypothetical protein